MKNSQILSKVRRICLALPDARETLTWGNPHFRVGDKIFCGFGDEKGGCTVGFKLEKSHAAQRVQLPGFSPAPYVGRHGWVSMDASEIVDWDDVQEMILESYRLIAPKTSLSKLSSTAPRKQDAGKKVAKKPVAKKTAGKNKGSSSKASRASKNARRTGVAKRKP